MTEGREPYVEIIKHNFENRYFVYIRDWDGHYMIPVVDKCYWGSYNRAERKAKKLFRKYLEEKYRVSTILKAEDIGLIIERINA